MRIFFTFYIFIVSSLFANEVKTIAFAQDNMANDFRKAQVFEARDEAFKHDSLHFIYSDAKAKTSLLIYQIDKFIQQKVDVIIVGTNDANAVVPVLNKARAKGVETIILDRGVNTQEYTTFINSNNIEIGQIGARYIAQKLNGKGVVLLFEGLQNADVTHLRSEGFLKEMAKHEEIKVIKRVGNYLRRDAIKEMESVIKEGVHIDAIFSQSDSMLSGARSAMLRFQIDPSSLITVGCDYTSEAREAIKNGKQSASILFPLGGVQSIQVAQKILQGHQVPKHISIPIKLITKENVDNSTPIF